MASGEFRNTPRESRERKGGEEGADKGNAKKNARSGKRLERTKNAGNEAYRGRADDINKCRWR